WVRFRRRRRSRINLPNWFAREPTRWCFPSPFDAIRGCRLCSLADNVYHQHSCFLTKMRDKEHSEQKPAPRPKRYFVLEWRSSGSTVSPCRRENCAILFFLAAHALFCGLGSQLKTRSRVVILENEARTKAAHHTLVELAIAVLNAR